MKRAKYLLLPVFFVLACSGTVKSQIQNGTPYGFLMSRLYFTEADMASMTMYNTAYGTARSAAMGGAFTSLGADLYSINLNPAGLGMYQSSEFSISPSLNFGKMEQSHAGGSMDGGGRTMFGFNNVGLATNLFQSSGTLTSFTLGFSYNKIADFNYRSSFAMGNNRYSVADIFLQQLSGKNPEALLGSEVWRRRDIPVSDWGAILSYKTFLSEFDEGSQDYYVNGFGDTNTIDNMMNLKSTGSIGEYSFAGGFNLRNKVYLGFTLSFQSISREQTVSYSEYYSGDYGSIDPGVQSSGMDYVQKTRLDGFGFNMKFGAIYRPIPELRLGVAVHTPTWASVEPEYTAYMTNYFRHSLPSQEHVSTSKAVFDDYDYRTPTRLMFGASYTFGSIGIISFDYERTWYDGTRLEGESPAMEASYRHFFSDYFKASNTYRVGLEVRPVSRLALRAGFALMESNKRDTRNLLIEAPMPYEYHNISAGIGYALSRNWALDLAYVFTETKYTGYEAFYYDYYKDPIPANDIVFTTAYPIDKAKRKSHNVLATISYRF